MFFGGSDDLLLLRALLDLVLETLDDLLDGELSFSRIDIVLGEVSFDGLLGESGSEGVEHLRGTKEELTIRQSEISRKKTRTKASRELTA